MTSRPGWILTAAIVLIASVSGVSQTICIDQKANDKVLSYVSAREGNRPDVLFLQVNCRGDLEDAFLLVLKYFIAERDIQIPHFRFVETRLRVFAVEGGKIKGERMSLDGNSVRYWALAINQESGEILPLANFADGREGFNELIGKFGFKVVKPEDALEIAYWYWKVAKPESIEANIVFDEMNLKEISLKDFRNRFSRSARYKKYSQWWSSTQPNIRGKIVPPAAKSCTKGFCVSFSYYARGVILQRSLVVHFDGTIEE